MIALNDQWEFTEAWSDAFVKGEGKAEEVRLPHNVGKIPLHYASPEDYSGICGYRKRLHIPAEAEGKRLFLQFDGAAHIATVYVDGQEKMTHFCGYTGFRTEITGCAAPGEDCLVAVRLDTTENPKIPPFGFVIDYLTYGGLYREVWLDVRGKTYLEDVFVYTRGKQVNVKLQADGAYDRARITVSRKDVPTESFSRETREQVFSAEIEKVRSWTPEHPVLYTCKAELLSAEGEVLDEKTETFGFRNIRFRKDGFYLNGRKIFLRGLNRHQSYPYMGYAAPERLQREDARILKEELACTAVRTSHYPQSHHFIDECDRLGLLVFMEIPGWQHIGDKAWKEQACSNVREMILQYRNHPSIILWGVRINESVDDDAFYQETNRIAHQLDPTRATSGVRFLEKSRLLEDVYAFNDFSHNGVTPGCRKKEKVTPDADKAFLISEHNGHMFPTKSYDSWEKRQEHALRHARVQDAAAASNGHAGCFGWCMFDYQTHKDFGSGDRICYHGVLDMFRNPKLAAALYASQGEKTPVLEVGSSMDIGDYPAGQPGDVYIFTNADEVELYKNDQYVTTFYQDTMQWSGLPHGPMLVDDTIGALLETQEGFSEKQADLIRRCLQAARKYGMSNLPPQDKLLMARAMVQYRMTMQDGMNLYGKYVGNWGAEATRWRFDGKKDGRVTVSVTRCPGRKLHFETKVSSTELEEGDTYDVSSVRIRILDEFGNPAVYAQLPLRFSLTGDAELIGPPAACAEGGMCGTYVKTAGREGRAVLKIEADGIEPVEIGFTIKKKQGN
ncbi:MAG: glycoside hydrolase family 2 protein [Blautia sp.]|nr:glycoside hydrolase family 2 protein [Blautia sp.]